MLVPIANSQKYAMPDVLHQNTLTKQCSPILGILQEPDVQKGCQRALHGQWNTEHKIDANRQAMALNCTALSLTSDIESIEQPTKDMNVGYTFIIK